MVFLWPYDEEDIKDIAQRAARDEDGEVYYDATYIRGREVDDEENKKMVIFWRWRMHQKELKNIIRK